jgi:hypothetical protein
MLNCSMEILALPTIGNRDSILMGQTARCLSRMISEAEGV